MIRIFVLFAAMLACALPASAETPTRGIIELQGADGTRLLQVEIADEPGEHARGLMYRTALPAHAGMLFLYKKPRLASFWMKNTVIPLDLLFIGPHGRIVKIARKTTPYSLEPISSGEVVTGVLEINGGASSRLGIEIGDRARWLEFPTKD